MSYANILVHVDHTKSARPRAEAAAALATRFRSFPTGAFLRAEAAPAYAVSDAITMPSSNVERYIEERSERIRDACHSARSMFASVLDAAGLPFHWLEINGDKDEAFVSAARRHDLVVIPPVMEAPFGQNTIEATQVAMACGGPVLVVPPSGYNPEIGKKILVAWNDSREAARVLRDAWPFLARAEEIHLLIVSPHAGPQVDEQLQRHFRQHVCHAPRVVVDRRDDLITGNVISRHIGMTGADMAVLGFYGHSRLREMMFGGVSRQLLEELPAPLLVSH
ncbi:MAG TPA: universal stress protein [Hyphomonadaceae bacterium]|nr:universal stress protein [Hyphomonadaceae bacterium]